MTFEQKVKGVDDSIGRGYLDLVVNSYHPLFEEIKTRAKEHMVSEQIPLIDLEIHSGLTFKQDGEFYNGKNEKVDLRELPKIYQKESNYIAGCGDNRSHRTPSIHEAMKDALSHFRDKVKKSLADVL